MSLNEELEPEQPDPDDTISNVEAQLRDLQTHFEQQAAEPASEPEVTPDEDGRAEEPGGGDSTPAAERVSLLGRDFDQSEAESLVGFYDWVRSHPEQAYAIDAFMRGQAQFVVPEDRPPQQQQQQAQPEPEEDLSDLPPSVRAKLAEIDELRNAVGTVANDSMARRHAEAQAVVHLAGENFGTKYGLGADEVEELQRDAAQLNIIPSYIAQGAPWAQAVEEALDVAYWRNPKYREAHAERIASQAKKDQTRQRKAASVSGGSGSAPRTANPADTATPEGRRAAMVAAIAAAQNGNGQ